MTDWQTLLDDLASGDEARAEAAAIRLTVLPLSALEPLLRSENVDVRWWALRALADFPTSEEVINRLVQALDDPSDEIRQCAALGLCHHPHLQAIAPLIGVLASADSMTAHLVRNALVAIGSPAVPALIELLQSGTPAARLEAVRALSEIGDPRAIPALMAVMQTDSALSTHWAKQGLDKLGLGMLYLKPG
ncbi:MAG: hypothetical protein DDG60_04950 [Anaerolineae bacterium]|nr:MAG: hypothetical protein DDG60_04950 [Anaerolineae bacterium]